mmetsp:Transcript_3424/g.8911  ORF Transcript_3424/g.8911 Transcript_3424/m.8911 type:complete len:373 (-) Transcript_3424:290-1408(-)
MHRRVKYPLMLRRRRRTSPFALLAFSAAARAFTPMRIRPDAASCESLVPVGHFSFVAKRACAQRRHRNSMWMAASSSDAGNETATTTALPNESPAFAENDATSTEEDLTVMEAEKTEVGGGGKIRRNFSRLRGLFLPRHPEADAANDRRGEEMAEKEDVFDVMRRAISDAKLRQQRVILRMQEDEDDFPRPVASLHVYLDRITAKAEGGRRLKLGNAKWDDFDRVMQFLRDFDGVLRNDATISEVIEDLTGSFRVDLNRTRLGDLDITLFPFRVRGVMVALHEADGFELVRAYGDVQLNLEKRVLELDFDQVAILGFSADLPKKPYEAGVAAAEYLERPFRDEIETNRTSEPMGKVLDLFDEWYLRVLDAVD